MDNKENNNENGNPPVSNIFGTDILREEEPKETRPAEAQASAPASGTPETNPGPAPIKVPEQKPLPKVEGSYVPSHYHPSEKTEYTKFTPDGKSLAQIAEEAKQESEKANASKPNEGGTFTQNEDVVEDELYEAYIGKRYKKFKKRKFSFAAFLFGPFYLMYRKLYMRGIFIYLLMCFLAIYIWKVQELNYIIIGAIYFVIALLLGLTTNKRYMNKATNQILNLKSSNPKASNENLINQCKSIGGTSFASVIVIVIVFAIASYLLSLYIFTKITPEEIKKIGFKDIVEKIEKINIGKKTEEKIKDTINNKPAGIIDQRFSYTIPEIFISNSNSSEGIGYTYKVDDANYCSLSFLPYQSDQPTNEFLADKAIANSETATPAARLINGINWAYYDYFSEGLKTFNYAIDDNGRIYMFRFIISTKDDDLDQRCQIYHDQIINSITMKE